MLLFGVLLAVSCSAQDLADAGLAEDQCGEECSLKLLQKRSRKETVSAAPKQPCLCLFDTDRTLTAVQDHYYNPPFDQIHYPKTGPEHVNATCPGTVNHPLSKDSAYPENFSGPDTTLRLSEFFVNYQRSFCAKHCYAGILSVGSIGGQHITKTNKSGYFRMVNTIEFFFNEVGHARRLPCSDPNLTFKGKECSIDAVDAAKSKPEDLKPFIINIGQACYNKDPSLGKFSGTCKVDFVRNVTAYYNHFENVTIPDENVYFFDDACVNVAGFQGSKYRARQISCGKRQCWKEPKTGFAVDNNLGVCGATSNEVESALTGPPHYLCTVDAHGKCDASYGCLDK